MNDLVMYDHQTDSLWPQFFGEAIDGPLKGEKLEIIAVLQTTWQEWLDLYPDTVVLDKKGRYSSDSYRGYYSGGSKGVLGESRRDDRLDAKDVVLAMNLDGAAKAYSVESLKRRPIFNDSLAGRQVLIILDPKSEASVAYFRSVAERVLNFALTDSEDVPQPLMIDQETGSKWSVFTGQAVEGPLRGTVLERIPIHYSFWFAWTDFYPHTELYTG